MHFEVQSIGYHILEQQLVKRLLKGCNLISKNICEKLIGWKSLLLVASYYEIATRYLNPTLLPA